MNTQNISALAEKLKIMGFENHGYSLIKRICFKPDNFCISKKVEKEKDKLCFQLYFEKNSKENAYVLKYYDAILQKEISFPNTIINGINIIDLEKQMAAIDWKKAFDFEENKTLAIENRSDWQIEEKIEVVIETLTELQNADEGKAIATGMKLKYWANVPYQELLGTISPLKTKSEVSQRFYFFDGQAGISIDEAYRFLQNKHLEKQMQAKRRQSDETEEDENDSQATAGNGLLKKKRISKPKGTKRNKVIPN